MGTHTEADPMEDGGGEEIHPESNRPTLSA
jgi:hypothetical protein